MNNYSKKFFKLMITKRSSAKFLLVYCRPFFKKKGLVFFFCVISTTRKLKPTKKKKKNRNGCNSTYIFCWLPFSGKKKETRLLPLWVKHLKSWLKCCNSNKKNDYNNQKKLLELIFIKYLISMVQKNI